MATPKTILITAASGNIGRVLVPFLASQKPAPKLVLPTASIERLKAGNEVIRKSDSSSIVLEEGSIKDPIWFESILTNNNVDAVFLCLTGTDELFTAMNCLDAISRAGTVKKVVYLSIIGDFTSESGAKDVYRDRSYPHIFAKVVVEQKLLYANYPFSWTVLGPAFFFTNDLLYKEPLTKLGLYPQPNLDKGGSKTSLDDIVLAALNVFRDTSNQWHGRKISLGSRHSYTTSETGELWSQALGKPIQTQSHSPEVLDQLEQTLRKTMGPDHSSVAWARDLRLLFEYAIAQGIHMSEEPYKAQVELLGKEPGDYGAWVRKIGATWV